MKMHNLFKNKSGDGDKIFSIWWVVMFVIVLGGLVIGVFIFYSSQLDTRGVEAEILYTKIMECVSEGGYVQDFVFEEDFEKNFFKKCNLDKEVIIEKDEFYLKVNFLDVNKRRMGEEISFGDETFKTLCNLEEKKLKDPLGCFSERENLLFYNETADKVKQLYTDVFVAVNQQGNKFTGKKNEI
jgi:hypothetical protein